MHVATYVGLVRDAERELAEALDAVAAHHRHEPDVEATCELLAEWSREKRAATDAVAKRYGSARKREPKRLRQDLFGGPRTGGVALLRDLQDLYLLAAEAEVCWIVLAQAADALRDEELAAACASGKAQTKRQLSWLLTRLKQAAPQALVVA